MISQSIYANTLAEYEAKNLLSREKLRRIAGTGFGDAVKILIEYGYFGDYPSSSLSPDVDGFITAQIRELTAFVEENCPCAALTKALLNRFVYSDAKALFKARCAGFDVSGALYLENDTLRDAFANQKYASLPPFLQNAVSALGEKPSAKEIDRVFTNAMFQDNLASAAEVGASFVRYCKREIDIANILSAYRAEKMNFNAGELLAELFEGGEISSEDFAAISGAGFAALSRALKGTVYEEAAFLLESGNIPGFRKHTSELLFGTLKNEYTDFTGFGPFIRYFISRLSEIQNVNFILICSKNNIAFDLNDLWSPADDF